MSMHLRRVCCHVASALVLALAEPASAQSQTTPPAADKSPANGIGMNAQDIPWRASATYPEVSIANLGRGGAGGAVVIRARYPDGYVEPPHSHTPEGQVTVLSGVVHYGVGTRADRAATKAYRAGAFFTIPPNVPHFLWVEGETVIQAYWLGAPDVVFVDPKDDPRRAKQ
ncbi:MAG: cupin domain-containing protein [Usitatibacteraceae bacterium]